MPKFRKKPVVIEAVQITDSTFDDPHPNPTHLTGVQYDPRARCVRISTLEGEMIGQIGDWIITGVKGEKYPCKPDIFEATYEPASTVAPEEKYTLNDLVIPSLAEQGRLSHAGPYGPACHIEVRVTETDVRLRIGPRDWHWDRDTGEPVAMGTDTRAGEAAVA